MKKRAGVFVPLSSRDLAALGRAATVARVTAEELARTWLVDAISASRMVAAKADHARFDVAACAIRLGAGRGLRFDLAGETERGQAIASLLDAHDPNWRSKLAEQGEYGLPSLIAELVAREVTSPRGRRSRASP